MKNIIVLVWRRSPTYQPYYVEKMIRSLHRNVENPDIHVLTDELVTFDGATTRMTTHHEWFGWWSKMEVFKPGLFQYADQHVTYLDLDTIITSPINDLFEIECDFTGVLERPLNSSIMRFRPSKMGFLYDGMVDYWARKTKARYHGDQDLIGAVLAKKKFSWKPIHEHGLKGVVSYKHTVRGKEFNPEAMRIILFHGKPKPHELLENSPLREYWV